MDTREYEKDLIERIVKCIEKHNGKDLLSSIILTGSFGRHEPSYRYNADGSFELKSDIEIALVHNKKANKNDIEELISKVKKEFLEDLNLMPIDENRVKKIHNFNNSLFVPKYKTIFTYDLFNGSYTIFGRDFLIDRNVKLEEVDIYEAKRIIANRIGELEYLKDNEKLKEQLNYLKKQWKGKTLLAIVSAWLILNGKYVTSYKGQYKKFFENEKNIEDKFGKSFICDYVGVFKFLREDGTEYDVSEECLRNYIKIINEDMVKLNKIKVNSLSRKIKYFFKYVKTDKKFGIINFENRIIQALIDEYATNNNKIKYTSNVWHNVLY